MCVAIGMTALRLIETGSSTIRGFGLRFFAEEVNVFDFLPSGRVCPFRLA